MTCEGSFGAPRLVPAVRALTWERAATVALAAVLDIPNVVTLRSDEVTRLRDTAVTEGVLSAIVADETRGNGGRGCER